MNKHAEKLRQKLEEKRRTKEGMAPMLKDFNQRFMTGLLGTAIYGEAALNDEEVHDIIINAAKPEYETMADVLARIRNGFDKLLKSGAIKKKKTKDGEVHYYSSETGEEHIRW